MRFAEPMWLLAGLLACAGLLVLYRAADRWRLRALRRFASHHLVAQLTASLSPGRRALKRALVLCGLLCVCAALARPQLGFHWEEARRQGIDILFAVDTSRSMLAQDVRPDRLTRAKLAVSDLVGKFDGDRVGLIAFAGEAFLQCPLTLDHDVFRESLAALEPGIIPRGGTDIAQAIREALAALSTEPRNHKILVLLTDGEDLEGQALAAARDAGRDGLRIYTIGVGTPQGELIPVPGGQFLRDESGALVKSRLDERMMTQIAEATGGVYQPLGQQGEGLEVVYQHSLAQLPKQELASRMHKVYYERYQWPLLLGLVCLTLELVLGERRRRAAALRAAKRQRATGFQQVAAALLCLALPAAAYASPQSAERAYKRGDYGAALKDYAQAAGSAPGKSVLQFNVGAAAYKDRQYDQAAAAFDKALRAGPVELQEQAYYDLGNTQYRSGEKLLGEDRQKTIEAWKQAIASYESALKLRQEDADAKFNRDFVKRRLEELEKQQKQDQQKQDQQKQQKDQQSKQDQKKQDQGGQGQQNQQAQNQQNQQGQGQQKQKNQNGQGQQQNQQQAQNQQGPQQQQGQQPAQASHQQQPAGEEESGQRPVPGQMTKDEANSLFDSLRDEGRRMPIAPDARSGQPRQDQPPSKDW